MHFVCDDLACCSLYWKNGRSETKYLWDSTTDKFLDQIRHILEFATTENHNKREISVVGRSGCGVKWKKWGKERTLSKILAISQHAMQSWCWQSRQGQDAPEQKAVARPGRQIRTKKSLRYTATNIVTHYPLSIYTVTELFSGLQFYSVSGQKRTKGIQNIVYKSSITMPSGCEAKLQFSKECTESQVLGLSLRDTAP